jgi:hypothetical protein
MKKVKKQDATIRQKTTSLSASKSPPEGIVEIEAETAHRPPVSERVPRLSQSPHI